MNLPKISIVVPSYNKIKYIDATLNSIIRQKYPNLEVIIQDGGSTDGTLEIIKKYAKRYPKEIMWESKKDNGQLDAINKGFRKSTGEILAYINADDEYERGAFGKISKAYQENPKSLWFSGKGIVVNQIGSEIAKPVTLYKNILLSLSNYNLLLVTNYLIQPSVFLTREAFKKYGPFSGTRDFIMEYDLWLKLGKVQMPVVIDKVLSRFRIEPSTKTKRLFSDLLSEDARIVRKFTKNPLILLLHDLNNLGRVVVERFV